MDFRCKSRTSAIENREDGGVKPPLQRGRRHGPKGPPLQAPTRVALAWCAWRRLSSLVDSLQFKSGRNRRGVESDFEVLEKARHPQKSGHWQLISEACFDPHHLSAGDVEGDRMNIDFRALAGHARCLFQRPLFDVQADCFTDIGVEKALRCSGVNDGLEALCRRRMLNVI
jgi:hypothetical protein